MRRESRLLVASLVALLLATTDGFAQNGDDPGKNKAADKSVVPEPAVNLPQDNKKQSEPKAQADETKTRSMSSGQALVIGLTIFVLAIFVGFEVITKVPPTLHTPLMSGSNAISGITIVGAIIVAGLSQWWFPRVIGLIAVALATVNVVGGFLVTHRMLAMFKKK